MRQVHRIGLNVGGLLLAGVCWFVAVMVAKERELFDAVLVLLLVVAPIVFVLYLRLGGIRDLLETIEKSTRR